jgi:serine/threonine protein kinase
MLNQAMQLNISNQQDTTQMSENGNAYANENSAANIEDSGSSSGSSMSNSSSCRVDGMRQCAARRAQSVDHSYGCNSAASAVSSISSLSPVYYSAELRDFVSQCLHVDPYQRPTAKELLAHPFISDADVDIESMRTLSNKQFWSEELESNVKDLHAMLTNISASHRMKQQQQHATNLPEEVVLQDHEIAMLSAQFGLDIYTVRQIAQASDLKVQ